MTGGLRGFVLGFLFGLGSGFVQKAWHAVASREGGSLLWSAWLSQCAQIKSTVIFYFFCKPWVTRSSPQRTRRSRRSPPAREATARHAWREG